jgi:PKD repeat protein
MNKQLSFTLGLALFVALSGFSQEGKVQPCNTYAAMEEHFVADPQARKAYEANQKLLESQLENFNQNQTAKSAAPVYTIPVVFHILHQGGGENISDAQCMAALDQVNKDFAKLGSDINTIAQPFQNLYIDSEIRFKLAKKDPNGNCTSGIRHVYDSRTVWAQNNPGSNYSGITWNPTKYLNVIIVKQIVPTGTVTGGGIIVGYTYKPGSWSTGALQDAIVYNYNYLNGLQARSLSHEIGHWLNLSHTFGNTNNPGVNCGDDGIADTPPTKGNFSQCPSSMSGNACAAASTTAYAAGQDNVHNIMDYSSCPKNFTGGQTNAMRNALTSMVSNRQNLWQTSNLIATDVDGLGNCAPIAEYFSSNGLYSLCAGGSLNFKDFSYNGSVTSYNWSADNGAFASSPNNAITDIVFPNLGLTTVTLTVSNSQGSSTKIRTVNVLDATPGITGPFVEGFEAWGTPGGWAVINNNIGSSTWEQSFSAAFDGGASFFINGSGAGGGQIDILESPIIDVQSVQDATFDFSISYAQKATNHIDNLKLQASKDCGTSWTDIVVLSSNQMQLNTGGVTAVSYTPASYENWKKITASDYPNWSLFSNSQHVIFRFTFVEAAAGGGNNLYLDAINLTGPVSPTGINKLSQSIKLGVYPNPTSGEATVRFSLNDPATVKVSVINMLGQEVLAPIESTYSAGERSIALNQDNLLPKGIYSVNISINGANISRKLIVK